MVNRALLDNATEDNTNVMERRLVKPFKRRFLNIQEMSFVDFHVIRDILATYPSYNELHLFLILMLAIIKAVHVYNCNTYKEKSHSRTNE